MQDHGTDLPQLNKIRLARESTLQFIDVSFHSLPSDETKREIGPLALFNDQKTASVAAYGTLNGFL